MKAKASTNGWPYNAEGELGTNSRQGTSDIRVLVIMHGTRSHKLLISPTRSFDVAALHQAVPPTSLGPPPVGESYTCPILPVQLSSHELLSGFLVNISITAATLITLFSSDIHPLKHLPSLGFPHLHLCTHPPHARLTHLLWIWPRYLNTPERHTELTSPSYRLPFCVVKLSLAKYLVSKWTQTVFVFMIFSSFAL